MELIYLHACAKMPRTSKENNRRPGCCSCYVYDVDVVIAGDDGDNDGDGGGEVFVLDF